MAINNAKILVIDDDPGICMLIRKTLEKCGFTTKSICTGTEGLIEIRQSKYDIILIDYYLPDMNAEEFVNLATIENLSVPFVTMTGTNDTEIVLKMMKLGALDFVTKTTSFLDLIAEIVIRSIERIRDKQKIQELELFNINSERINAFSTLAAGIGHEINNPLFIALGNINEIEDLIKDKSNSTFKKIETHLNAVKASLETINFVSKKIKFFSEISLTQKTKINIKNCIQEILSDLDGAIKNLNIDVQTTFESEDHFMSGDYSKIKLSITNIILNSIEAIELKNTKAINTINNLIISVKNSGSQSIEIQIIDNGIGISMDNLHKIFDIFYTTKPPSAGKALGIGLSLSNAIIKNHNGIISVNSEIGKGTQTKITFPLCENNQKKNDLNNDDKIKTVLIVDDEPDSLILLGRQFSRISIETEFAKNAYYAEEKIFNKKYDLIAADIKMPGKSGIELAQKIIKYDSKQKFMLITGEDLSTLTKNEVRFISQHNISILTKPVDKNDLLSSINKFKIH